MKRTLYILSGLILLSGFIRAQDTGWKIAGDKGPQPRGKQVLVLGEFGGLGLPLEGHTWLDKNNWGYKSFRDADTLFMTYDSYLNQIVPFIKRSLSAAIYTQTTDVEVECNELTI
jgi:hypothetical protein